MTNNLKQYSEEYLNGVDDEKSLLNLFKFIKTNEKKQKDLYLNLTEKGILKLFTDIKHKNIDIRRNSAKVLIFLLHNNEILQNLFLEKFSLNPIGNLICLNWFPQMMNEVVDLDPCLINEIRSSKFDQTKMKYWIWPINSIYSDTVFPDPNKYLIGFFYSNRLMTPYSSCIFNNYPRISETKISEIIEYLEKESDDPMQLLTFQDNEIVRDKTLDMSDLSEKRNNEGTNKFLSKTPLKYDKGQTRKKVPQISKNELGYLSSGNKAVSKNILSKSNEKHIKYK